MMVNLSRALVASVEVKTHTRRDPVLSRVLEFVLKGWPEEFSASESFQPYVAMLVMGKENDYSPQP